jgi:hypothetical protein
MAWARLRCPWRFRCRTPGHENSFSGKIGVFHPRASKLAPISPNASYQPHRSTPAASFVSATDSPPSIPVCPGREPPFLAVKHPVHPYSACCSATQTRFIVENAEGRAGPDRRQQRRRRDLPRDRHANEARQRSLAPRFVRCERCAETEETEGMRR